MNLKCGYFTVGGIMCGSLVGIFVGALAVNASLGYMILLLGVWGLCLYMVCAGLRGTPEVYPSKGNFSDDPQADCRL